MSALTPTVIATCTSKVCLWWSVRKLQSHKFNPPLPSPPVLAPQDREASFSSLCSGINTRKGLFLQPPAEALRLCHPPHPRPQKVCKCLTRKRSPDFFFSPRAAPETYGGSRARGLIGAEATGLCHSHSNVGSEPDCDLHHSSRQRRILNPLSRARGQILLLMDTSQARYH